MSANNNHSGASSSEGSNPLEIFREIRKESTTSLKKNLVRPMSKEALEQIFGKRESTKHGSEIFPGQSANIKELISKKFEQKKQQEAKRALEKKLRSEEESLVATRTNELRIQIQALQAEVKNLAEVTIELNEEVKIAAFQAPVDISTYQLFFFDELYRFIKGFREKIHQADVWLAETNKRASKKNLWGTNYKKYGAKYLLSSEHYSQRSSA